MSSYVNGKRTRLARIWNNMKKRCLNKRHESYKYYGGKGITVCDEWMHNFDAFEKWALENGYKDDLTIDRIDCAKGYSPDNCRWATTRQQAHNRSSNRLITFKGETHTLTQWAELLNINFRTLSHRIYILGWPVERALNTPVDMRFSNRHKEARC